jgi:hypothetical protein
MQADMMKPGQFVLRLGVPAIGGMAHQRQTSCLGLRYLDPAQVNFRQPELRFRITLLRSLGEILDFFNRRRLIR